MNARDIMVTDVVSVTKDTPLNDIARLMVEQEISGIPVLEENGKLVGMVTERDLLVRAKKLDLPTFLPFIGGVLYLEGPGKLDEEVRKATGTRAEEIMTTKIHTVSPDTSLQDLATIMVEQTVNRLPVVESGNILVGMITRSDVVKAVASDLE